MHFRQALFLCVSICACTSAKAQLWTNAVIVLTTADTLTGQIEFVDSRRSESSINYRSSSQGRTEDLNTQRVLSYRLPDKNQFYERLDVTIKHYSNDVVQPGANPVIETERIVVFADVMFASPYIKLYSITDKHLKERLFISKGDQLAELIHVEYQVSKNGSDYSAVTSTFQAQLRSFTSDCGIKQRSMSFSAREIIKLLQDYAVCKGGRTDFVQ